MRKGRQKPQNLQSPSTISPFPHLQAAEVLHSSLSGTGHPGCLRSWWKVPLPLPATSAPASPARPHELHARCAGCPLHIRGCPSTVDLASGRCGGHKSTQTQRGYTTRSCRNMEEVEASLDGWGNDLEVGHGSMSKQRWSTVRSVQGEACTL